MTTIHVDLPDDLAAQARAAGLLSEARIVDLLREQLRKRKVDELRDAMMRATYAADEVDTMTAEDVSEETRQMRAERRADAQ